MTVPYRVFAVIAAISSSSMAQAQPTGPDWSRAKEIDVKMTNFSFAPDDLVMAAGVAYRIHFVNDGSSDHNFTSPDFIAQVDIMPGDAGKLREGMIEVPEGKALDVILVPTKPGTYKFHCSHFMHALFGMRGRVTVR